MMLSLADAAWAELMKEKIKILFEKERGSNMDKVAEVATKASMEFWAKKMSGTEADEEFFKDFGKKLDAAFSG